MAVNDDDCIKRIIKSYLFFNEEATTSMIVKHIYTTGYGIRKKYTPSGLASMMSKWSKKQDWFNITSTRKNNNTYWRLRQ